MLTFAARTSWRTPEIGERIGHEVVRVRVLDRDHLRRVERHVVIDGDRIVRIEASATATTGVGCASSSASKRQAGGHVRAADLKDIAEHDVEVFAVAAAEPGVDPENRAVVGVESKAEAVGIFEVLEVEVRSLSATLPAS